MGWPSYALVLEELRGSCGEDDSTIVARSPFGPGVRPLYNGGAGPREGPRRL